MIPSVRKAVCCGFTAGLALAVAEFSSTNVDAAGYDVGSLHIAQPWARATPKGASVGAAYMTITNNGTAPDRVSCLSSSTSTTPFSRSALPRQGHPRAAAAR